MSVQHHFPSWTVWIADGISVSPGKPDVQVWKTPYGGRGARSFTPYLARNYTLALSDRNASADAMATLESFLAAIDMQGSPFWLLEPWSRGHNLAPLICGPELADGTRTTFTIPLLTGGTVNAIFANAAIQAASTYTIRSKANLVADDAQCNGRGGIGSLTAWGGGANAPTSIDYLARSGDTSIRVTFASGAANQGFKTSLIAVVAGRTYTFGASFLLTGSDTTAEPLVGWYKADLDPCAHPSDSIEVVGTPGTWIDAQDTVTAPATAAFAYVVPTKKDATTDEMFVGMVHLNPGDNPDVFLPSQVPQAVEFATAPVLRSRITAAGDGQKLVYLAIDDDYTSVAFENLGTFMPSGFKAYEVIPK